MLIMVLAPGLWDAFEYSVGTLGQKMHKYHNHPDLRPQVAWEEWTVVDSFITGIQVSWWLVVPTIFICTIIYQHKKVILSHFSSNIQIVMSNRAIRWLRVYVALFSTLPFGMYVLYDGFITHPFRDLPLVEVSKQSVQAIDGDLLFVHFLYYVHGGIFILLGLLLVVLVHGRDEITSLSDR